MRRPKDLIREPLPADATKRVVAAPEGIVGGDLGAAFPAVRMEQAELVEGVSLWQDAWKRLRRNKLAVAGGVIVLTVFILALAGPWLVYQYNGFTYQTQDLSIRLAQPSWQHPLGTDILGRDLLARLLYGSRISLLVGLIATMVSLVIGVTYGAISGYFGGRVDDVMMRIVDVIYSLPYIILVVILLALFERSLFLLFAALGAVSWLTMARIVRGQVLSLKNEQFIEAARSIGVSKSKIIFRHIVPEHARPCDRLRDAHSTVGDLARSLLELFGSGRAAADAFVGRARERRLAGHSRPPAAVDRAGRDDGADAFQPQFPGRRVARRARPADEKGMKVEGLG